MATEEASQDQRKRTLEAALERRFAVARAEAVQQQERRSNYRKFDRGSGREGDGRTGVTGTVSSSITSLDKDTEASDPTYSLLSQAMHENLLVRNLEISSRRGTGVDKVSHELLQKGDSAQKYVQGSRSMRLDDVILLDNYVPKRSTLAGAHLRALRSHSKRSKTRMSTKQHKKCGSFDLPQDLKFDFFKPMHEMWKGYIAELFKTSGNQLARCLLSADLHGAIMRVVECKVTSLSGASGIMIRETTETFGLITKDDRFQVVPKRGSVFLFEVDCWKITLCGDKLLARA
ncbi:Non-specific serine/threonine protein kinase [Psidium guajava]|nr:Non-specific serine/threonine protein kinase [Psidium guajava]